MGQYGQTSFMIYLHLTICKHVGLKSKHSQLKQTGPYGRCHCLACSISDSSKKTQTPEAVIWFRTALHLYKVSDFLESVNMCVLSSKQLHGLIRQWESTLDEKKSNNIQYVNHHKTNMERKTTIA